MTGQAISSCFKFYRTASSSRRPPLLISTEARGAERALSYEPVCNHSDWQRKVLCQCRHGGSRVIPLLGHRPDSLDQHAQSALNLKLDHGKCLIWLRDTKFTQWHGRYDLEHGFRNLKVVQFLLNVRGSQMACLLNSVAAAENIRL